MILTKEERTVKKKVRVKGNKKGNEINEEAKDSPPKEKEEPKKEVKDGGDIPPEVRLEELLSELTLNDKPEEANTEDDSFVDEFVSKLEKIKIEK